jgi:DNA mismatch repair protein MutL
LANQIAAGEVVERPASVVKELVENALDAGADNVVIEAEEAGVRLLRVRDNGGGIHRDDLPLALSRHATSKIATTRDLLGITSLGFRGEALASIASVTRLRLTSRARDADGGWSVESENEAPVPAAHPVGTTVEARDLFHNVPARRKFLRAERTEYEHLEEVVRRLALSNFAAGFTLRHNGRTIFTVAPAADTGARERRVAALLGRPFLEHAAAIDFEAAGLRLHGWIGGGGYTRSQADAQYVYLNGRMVRDRVIAHALRQAFGDLVPEGRFAAYLLYLDMDPSQVDVNVHPTKHEVRFRESRLVHDFLVSALRSALGEAAEWTAPRVAEAPAGYAPSPAMAPRSAPVREPGPEPVGRLIGLKAGRFLVVEGEEGLLVADLLSLVRQEALEAVRVARAAGPIAVRPLLIPATARVGSAGVRCAESLGDTLRAFGVDLQPVSADAVRVHGVPELEMAFDAALLATLVLEPGVGKAELPERLARAARVPADRQAWDALLARARQRPNGVVELDAAGLARLFGEPA